MTERQSRNREGGEVSVCLPAQAHEHLLAGPLTEHCLSSLQGQRATKIMPWREPRRRGIRWSQTARTALLPVTCPYPTFVSTLASTTHPKGRPQFCCQAPSRRWPSSACW